LGRSGGQRHGLSQRRVAGRSVNFSRKGHPLKKRAQSIGLAAMSAVPLSSFSATPVIPRAMPSRTSHAILKAASS
jgi:hypothetical protein